MHKPTIIFILLILIVPISAISQTPEIRNFIHFISKNTRLPDELKSKCDWMYAVVRVKTDRHNKIISYDFVNDPPQGMRNFQFLIGYKFPEKMKINGHPLVFYYAADNREICKPKQGDLVYNPNDVIEQFINMINLIKKDDPETIFITSPIFELFYPSIQKK